MTCILRKLSVLIAFTCAMRQWQYYFAGVHLPVFSLLLVAFCASYLIRCIYFKRIALPLGPLRSPILLLWSILTLSALSFFLLDFDLAPTSTIQFSKGLLDLSLSVAGVSAIVCFLSEQPPETTTRMLQAYILGAAASSLYSFFEVALAYYGYDLGKAIFGGLSVYGPDFNWSRPFYYEWDIFFRAVGFPGVNAQATYTASVIPLVIFSKPFRRASTNFVVAALCFAGTSLTFSRNGFFSLIVAFAFYSAIRPAWAARFLPRLAAICLPAIFLALVFSDGARQMIATRVYKSIDDVGAGRREIFGAAWRSIQAHPLGHGINQFSVVALNTDEIDLNQVAAENENWSDQRIRQAYANVHNNWLNWLFEGGWAMLALQLAYYASLYRICWRTRTPLGYAAVCATSSLLVSGFFNMTLDQFSSSLFFAITAVAAVRLASNSPPAKAPDRQETPAIPSPSAC